MSVAEIAELEERLRQAMVASNVETLDGLLAGDLIFTNHQGQRMTKQDDLEAHRAGVMEIDAIVLSDRAIRLLGDDAAVVTVSARITGQFAGENFDSTLRFTRVWKQEAGQWLVVAAQATAVQD